NKKRIASIDPARVAPRTTQTKAVPRARRKTLNSSSSCRAAEAETGAAAMPVSFLTVESCRPPCPRLQQDSSVRKRAIRAVRNVFIRSIMEYLKVRILGAKRCHPSKAEQ